MDDTATFPYPAPGRDDPELWTTDQVRAYLNLTTRASARAQLAAWGIQPVAREPGRAGQNLYPAATVKARKTAGRGRAWRKGITGPHQAAPQ